MCVPSANAGNLACVGTELFHLQQQLLGAGSAGGLAAPAAGHQSPAEPALLRLEHRLILHRRPQVMSHHRVEDVLPVAGVRLLSGGQLPQSDTEGEDVGFGRYPLSLQQLGGSVRVRASYVAHLRADSGHFEARVKFERTTEIRYFADVLRRQQHVGWFYVQMHHVVRVQEPQAVNDICRVPEPPVRPQRVRAAVNNLMQVPVADKLHQNGPDAALVSVLRRDAGGRRDDTHDVLVSELCCVQLSPEALPGRQLVLGALIHALQRHRLPEVLCSVYRAETSGAHQHHGAQLLPVDHRGPESASDLAVEPLSGDL